MKREFTRIAAVSAGLILLLPLPFVGRVNKLEDYLLAAGITALGIGLLWLFIGFILVLIQSTRKTGQAFMLTAAILLLLSVTFCSTGSFDFK